MSARFAFPVWPPPPTFARPGSIERRRARPTSLRQGYGGPPKLQRRRKRRRREGGQSPSPYKFLRNGSLVLQVERLQSPDLARKSLGGIQAKRGFGGVDRALERPGHCVG